MAETGAGSKKSNILTWVIVGIITLAFVLYFVFRTTGDKKTEHPTPDAPTAAIMDAMLQNGNAV